MSSWTTGDPEPGPAVDVLIDTLPSKNPYLARVEGGGWVWTNSLAEISSPVKPRRPNPLRWDFAISADGAVSCEVRMLTAAERSQWEIS
ncbi:hypothetical protein [Amycolatopsis kentuckyensis]|uniref:hypothetical protein n=1 Tax=Amycolatopsis kentuckyensis TaxID=218823 RepID=UPI0035695685